MMRKYSCFIFLLFPALTYAQSYWQQQADYNIKVWFDHNRHQFTGNEEIVYTNHSPDTLHRVFFHLYFNAFQPGSAMDVRSQTISDPDRRVGNRIGALAPEEIGYHRIDTLWQDGKTVKFHIEGTILEGTLATPLPPGQSTRFYISFNSQVPVQIRRSGRNSSEGIDYTITQWYPKLCEYDRDGWNTDPYVGREFYGVFGNYDVQINIHKKYLLGATGVLQNPQEIGKGYEEDISRPVSPPAGERLVWKFRAENVHDFAWAADPDYIHERVQARDGLMLHFIYQNDTAIADNWARLKATMVKFFQVMDTTFGRYPYPQFSFVQGGDGGMEYPMLTMVTSKGNYEGLVSVCTHEAIHNWYYGVLATHEGKYPWMDEGFTSYATDLLESILLGTGRENPFASAYSSYNYLLSLPDREPLSTHADFYNKNMVYSLSSYVAGEIFLAQLRYIIGEQTLYRCLRKYFDTWKFKHPRPMDFIRVVEKETGLELDWYLEQFVNSLNTIDYEVVNAKQKGDSTTIQIKRAGRFPMPVDIRIILTNGKEVNYYIPLDIMRGEKKEGMENVTIAPDWTWTSPMYTLNIGIPLRNITRIIIDPNGWMADVNRSNNSYEVPR